MAKFNIPLPPSRGFQSEAVQAPNASRPKAALDMFMYSTFARFALNDGRNVELETRFDHESNSIELIVPDDALDLITEINIAPNLRRFFDWQMGASGFLRNIVEDITPELGGPLDAGANTISFTELDNGESGTDTIINWASSNKQLLTLTANCNLAFADPAGACNLLLRLIQDGAGGHNVVLPANVLTSGGAAIALTAAAGSIDILTLYFDGTNYYILPAYDFS